MNKKTKRDPQDDTKDTGNGLTAGQEKALSRIVGRIGKTERPAYQGARNYPMLPEDL